MGFGGKICSERCNLAHFLFFFRFRAGTDVDGGAWYPDVKVEVKKL